ncbi:hypothetical protein GWK47_042112 [Chionoecetes opilio]|uniref:Uncharacterized protein n=1 Tax=Chionoecetes opilio TaxID=41210 RepID=A0A8J4YHF8_CHIOP|nr:hypothetical protein GWK47_042112 [Chionoecetes opilio]
MRAPLCQGEHRPLHRDEKHRGWHTCGPEACILANLHAGHQGRGLKLRRAGSLYGQGLREGEQKRRQCAVAIPPPLQPPRKPSFPPAPAYPFQQVGCFFQLEGTPISPSLTGSGVAPRGPSGDAPSARSSLFSDDGSNASASQRSCRARGERTSPAGIPGVPRHPGWGLRVYQHIFPQSNGRAGRQSSVQEVLRQHGRNGSLDTDPLQGPHADLNPPPQGSEASPSPADHRRQLRDAIPGSVAYEVTEDGRGCAGAKGPWPAWGQCSFPG